MLQDRRHETDVERAVLRVRLVGIALASTILALAPDGERPIAAAALLVFVVIATALRYAVPRSGSAVLRTLGAGADVGFVTALALALPLSLPVWPLYAIGIAAAALRNGALGAAALTALAIAAYDLALGFRVGEARALDLLPVQLLLLVGILAAELTSTLARGERERHVLLAHALAQRALASASSSDDLLARLVRHATRTFGVRAAWIEEIDASGRATARHRRGPEGPATTTLPLSVVPRRALATSLEPHSGEHAIATLRDLVSDASVLLHACLERERQAAALETMARVRGALRQIAGERTGAGILAQVVATATEFSGTAAIVRTADGALLAGDLAADRAATLARAATAPALVVLNGTDERVALVRVGQDRVLVALGTERSFAVGDLDALGTLGHVAGEAIARIERLDDLSRELARLETGVAELQRELRERDDAVASAVHELRTPLTSVQAYGQLMSRNLQAVQRQVSQLDRLIGDLLRMPTPLALDNVDLLREARDAAARIRVVASVEIDVDADPRASYVVQGDAGRLAQVLDNLLRNAAKFSPPDESIAVELHRGGEDIVLSVTDHGAGISADELPRIFERYYRGSEQRRAVPGEGIGLAVSREIVRSHGGRIWATSEGTGRGTTVSLALPTSPRTEPKAVDAKAAALATADPVS